MSRWVLIIVVIILVGSGTALALPGSGTQEDPWRIESLVNFNEFAADENYWDDYTRLETDVNLAGMVYERAVIAPDVNDASWFQGTPFTGVFDGNNHKITNLTIDDAGVGNGFLGLFGFIDDGEVSNLGLEGGSISGQYHVGGLVGLNFSVSVSNCYSTGDVSGDWEVGGLVGTNNASISDCYSTGDVSGISIVGGLVGMNTTGSILNCYSTGDVSGTGDAVGGLLGGNYSGSISNCYATGDVNGVDDVGGLSGDNFDGSVSNCYATGDVNGVSHVGGLSGRNGNSISNCFWDTTTQTHGVTESIGDPGGTITNVLGLPTHQLHQQSTFTDWDFINVWNIGENQTYPHLRVYLPSDINKDGIVNFLDLSITANQWMEQ